MASTALRLPAAMLAALQVEAKRRSKETGLRCTVSDVIRETIDWHLYELEQDRKKR